MRTAFTLLALGLLASGCFGVEDANTHLASMDTSTASMDQSTAKMTALLADDQKYIAGFNDKIDKMETDMSQLRDEVGTDRQYLEAVSTSMKGISSSLTDLSKLGNDTFQKVLKPMMEKTPDPKTPDALDILQPAQGSPQGT